MEMLKQQLPEPPPPAISGDLEAADPEPESVAVIKAEAKPAELADYDQENLDWAVKMIGFCLQPAAVIAVQFLKTDESHELPLAFHFLSLALILSFNSLFLSKFIAPKSAKTTKLLERLGLFFAVTAIYIAITIPLPVWLKFIAWTIFVVSCITFTILFCDI